MIITTLVCVTIIVLYLKMRKSYRYWKNMDILHVRPWPLFGYLAPSILRLKAFPLVLQDTYNVFPEQRYFGVYQFVTPVVVIRGPDLIKKILVEDFEVFPDHRPVIDPEANPLWAKNLYALKGGEQWQNLRTTLNAAFTDDQLKNIFNATNHCAKNFNNFLLLQNEAISVELKKASRSFANDVIALAVFGVSCNSLQNPRNEFYLMSKNITGSNLLTIFKHFGYTISPRLMKIFKFRLIDDRTKQFYENLINDGTAQNGKHLSNFFMQNDKTKVTDDTLSQVMHFLFAGFETVALGISFLLYELALNADIQTKLRAEVDSTRTICGDELSYEALIKMEYLDMVVAESLRKWPPTVAIDRKAAQSFSIEAINEWEKTTEFEAKTVCLLPIFAIHRDRVNYTHPDRFDPERFSATNKHKIKPFTYLPFGFGPRSCIGIQFALLQIKTLAFHLLSKFEIVPIDKTKNPIKLSKKVFRLVPDGGLWVGFEPREQDTLVKSTC